MVQLDRQALVDGSLSRDLGIIAKTALVVLGRRGAC
jgi:hypothetical protein